MESVGIMMAPIMLSSMLTTVAPVALIMGSDAFTKERIARGAAQFMIVSARAAVDITYGDLIFDERSNDFSIRDLRIELPEASGVKDCVIEIGAITIVSLDRPDALAFSTEGDGLSIAPSCFGQEGAMATTILGPEALNADHFSSTAVYHLGSSTYESTLLLETAAAGSVTLSTRMEGLHLEAQATGDPLPAGRITEVEITIQNTDNLRKLVPMLGAGDDTTGMMIAQLEAVLGADGLSEDDNALLESARSELARVMADGGAITLRNAPETEISFRQLERTNGPEDLVPILKPRFSLSPIAPDILVSAERLKVARSAPGNLDAAERLMVAKAVASGVGAPRSAALASALLEPMAAEGDAEAALEYARLLHGTSDDVSAAYRFALEAGAASVPGAWSTLDRIESDLPMEAILDLQGELASVAKPFEPVSDIAVLRSAARDYATGRGVTRDYRQALFLALLAGAAGDRASTVLQERLAGRFDDEDSQEAWRALEAEQSQRALDLWADGFGDTFTAQ